MSELAERVRRYIAGDGKVAATLREAADRIEALEAEVERLRVRSEKELDYGIALQRIIEGTKRGELSSLIPDNLYHLELAKQTVARIPDPDDLRTVLDSVREPSGVPYSCWVRLAAAADRLRATLPTTRKGEDDGE